MCGSVTFQEALKARLEIICPSEMEMAVFNSSKNPVDILTPGIQ